MPSAIAVAACLLLWCAPAVAADVGALARGDAAWSRRGEGSDGQGHAAPGPIGDAIQAYEEAVATAPDALEPRWKLVRARHFAADFASPDDAAARTQLDRATEQAEAGLDLLGRRVGGRSRLDALAPAALRAALPPGDVPDATGLYFWSAIAWGGWAQRHGLLGAVRQGVANRIHRGAEASVALDPAFEEGGAHRLLARLHASLPRVPLFSGWVDRAQALPEMERARAIAPEHPGNRMLLALTLLDVAPERRDEALALLEQVARIEPRPEQRVEDESIRRGARERLAEERAKKPAGANASGSGV
jgi:tetratricopeptide (TPR) repeat protein